MNFAYPQYLILLLLLPAIALLYWMARKARARKVTKYGQEEKVNQLMPEVSRYKPWLLLGLQLLLVALIVIIIARPRGAATTQSGTVHGIEVMVALDISNSMNAAVSADEEGVSRLQRSKLVLQRLIDKLQGNKVGLVVFAGNAYMQMPLTGDAQSAKMFLEQINTNLAPTQGTAIGTAINMCAHAFSENPKIRKSIIVITDGENFEDDAQGAASDAKRAGIQVNVVGIGSTEAVTIPTGNPGEVMLDDDGNVAYTKLNEEMAQSIADAGGGVYVDGLATDAVADLHDALDKLSKSNLGTYTFSQHSELFPVFAWIALLVLLAIMLLTPRKTPWLSKINFFTNDDANKE